MHLAPTYIEVLALLTLFLFTRTVHRLFLHPLSRFPGPRLAAVTKLYEAYWDLWVGDGGQFTSHVRDLHARYGPVVRINPHEISVKDPDFHEKLYAPQPAVRDKIPMIANILGTTAGTFGTQDHYHHRKRRSASSAFFSTRNVAKADALIRCHVDRLCQQLRTDTQAVVETRIRFMALKLDIFFDWAFAEELGLQQNAGAAREWDETMEAIATCAPYVKLMPWILPLAVQWPVRLVHAISPPLARVLRINHRIHKQASLHLNELSSVSGKTVAATARPMTLFQTLLTSTLPPLEKTVWRMSQEGAEMFAASGTTARVMTTCMFHLLNRPPTLALLQADLDQIIPNAADLPPTQNLGASLYLSAVIKESLRLSAPVATRLPLVAREPIVYSQWKIPAGIPLSVNTRDMMHDQDIFPDPFAFRPERWLDPKHSPALEKYLVPFNKGTRVCMGKEFAMSELQVTIAALFRRFEFELVDTTYERDVEVVRDCFLSEPRRGATGVKARVIALRK